MSHRVLGTTKLQRGKLSQRNRARKFFNINKSLKMSKKLRDFRIFKLKLNFHKYIAIHKISDLTEIK